MSRTETIPLALIALFFLVASAAPLGAQEGRAPGARGGPLIRPSPIELPEALDAFVAALARRETDPSATVRVFHYGDSNIAADLLTKVVRDGLGARYGSSEGGYLLPVGVGSIRRGRVAHVEPRGLWQTRRRGYVRDFGVSDGRYGLAGVSVEGAPGSSLAVRVPEDSCGRRLEVHSLADTPGHVEVRVDGAPIPAVPAEGGLALVRAELDGASHDVTVRVVGGRARVLGVVVERPHGLAYDVFGINGHRVSAINGWDEALLRAQIAGRTPDLVILSYGGNEAIDRGLPLGTYEQESFRAVAKVRGLAPDASCLISAPLATFEEHAPRMRAVAAIQRRVAMSLGCAFWDPSQLSGGPGSLMRWARFEGMVARDRLHYGPRGYGIVGAAFLRALWVAIGERSGAVATPR